MKTKIIIILCLMSLTLNIWSFFIKFENKPIFKKVHLMETFKLGWYEGYQRGLMDKTFGASAMRDVRRMFVIDSLDLELSVFAIK